MHLRGKAQCYQEIFLSKLLYKFNVNPIQILLTIGKKIIITLMKLCKNGETEKSVWKEPPSGWTCTFPCSNTPEFSRMEQMWSGHRGGPRGRTWARTQAPSVCSASARGSLRQCTRNEDAGSASLGGCLGKTSWSATWTPVDPQKSTYTHKSTNIFASCSQEY